MQEIRMNMQAAGVNATGKTSASVRVRETDNKLQLVIGGEDTAPAFTLEIGRRGGKVPAGFVEILKQWSIDKGINFSSESERARFAYFLSKKIAREGTERNKNNIDVYSSTVKAKAENIKALCREYLQGQIREIITGEMVTTNTNL